MTYEEIKEVQRTTDINFSPYYDVLPSLINERDYKIGCEIGVFAGGMSKSILDKTKLELMIGIDPYLEYKPNQIGMGTISTQGEFDIMCKLAMDRLDPLRFLHIRKTSDDAFCYMQSEIIMHQHYNSFYNKTKNITDEINMKLPFLDFVFFDGLHEAEQLKKDIENYVPLIKNGGIIAFHDYNHPTFPELSPVIDDFAMKQGQQLVICPLHLVYIEKNW